MATAYTHGFQVRIALSKVKRLMLIFLKKNCSKAGGGRDIFASVGADGSVRMFDLRHLEHSTIIYEDPGHTPLLRLAWNKQDPNYLATVSE